MDASLFKFYSFGTVAANKPRANPDGTICDMAEVFPKEQFTMSAGELTDSVETIEVKGKDAAGQDYQSELKTRPSIPCKWLPIGDPNRITPPDVRRGEEVLIYRYGDTEFYFWTNAFNNIIRKLETAVWWFSGTPEDGKSADTERGPDNGYFLEISSHEKHVIFSTSNKNGEVARYYLQFNGGDGNFILKDDLGQQVIFYSQEGKIEVTSEKDIEHNTETYTINCKKYILNAEESVEINTKATTLTSSDTIKMSTTTYEHKASGSVKYDTPIATFTGNATVTKLLSFMGGMSGSGSASGGPTVKITGAATFSGLLESTTDVKAGAISLTDHHHTARGATAATSPAQA